MKLKSIAAAAVLAVASLGAAANTFAGVTAGLGFVLSPAIGAVLMSLSTIVVAVNAQFLRKLDLG